MWQTSFRWVAYDVCHNAKKGSGRISQRFVDPTVSGSDQLQAYWFRIRPGMDPHRCRFPSTVNIPLFGLRLDQQKVSRKYYISGGGGGQKEEMPEHN